MKTSVWSIPINQFDEDGHQKKMISIRTYDGQLKRRLLIKLLEQNIVEDIPVILLDELYRDFVNKCNQEFSSELLELAFMEKAYYNPELGCISTLSDGEEFYLDFIAPDAWPNNLDDKKLIAMRYLKAKKNIAIAKDRVYGLQIVQENIALKSKIESLKTELAYRGTEADSLDDRAWIW